MSIITTSTPSGVRCWVNAANSVVLNRVDGKDWDIPVFVNVPTDVRIAILKALGKTEPTDKPTKNLSIEVFESDFVDSVIKSGDNAGKPIRVLNVISADSSTDGSITIREFISRLVRSDRNTTREEDKTLLKDWLGE